MDKELVLRLVRAALIDINRLNALGKYYLAAERGEGALQVIQQELDKP